MNILIIYASNSGGTYFVSELIEKILKKSGYTVIIRKANEIRAEDLEKYDTVILGSCTWQYESEEGQMHEHFHTMQKNLTGKVILPEKFAVFGLGDSSYFQFCNAVNHLEELVTSWGKKWIIPSLRINRFYADQSEKEAIVSEWTYKLITKLGNS